MKYVRSVRDPQDDVSIKLDALLVAYMKASGLDYELKEDHAKIVWNDFNRWIAGKKINMETLEVTQ